MSEPPDVKATGWSEFLAEFSGCSFNNGLYRTHNVGAIGEWNRIVSSTFSIDPNSLVCFGYDWLGRHFALDFDRVEAGEPLVLMFEPGTGDALEIPSNFTEFHDMQLTVHTTECLEPEYYAEWLDVGNEPLAHDRCAGYRVPLILGGEDSIDNLEASDMEVYWVILGQILAKIVQESKGA